MRALRALAAALLALAPALASPGSAPALPTSPDLGAATSQSVSAAEQCVWSGKVYVVAVHEGGGIVAQGCTGSFSTGQAALSSVASVTERQFDFGFVCQINGQPAKCIEGHEWAANGQRYWNYFHALPGQSWIYSQKGYRNRSPQPGSIEGWCYGTTPDCPSRMAGALNPSLVRAHRPAAPKPTSQPTRPATTAPATKAPTARKPSSTAPAQQPSSRRPQASSPAQPPSTARTSAAASAKPSRSAAATVTPSSSAGQSASVAASSTRASSAASTPPASTPTAVQSQPVATPPGGGGGTPWGTIATGGAIATVAAGFGIHRLRSRRTDGDW